MKISVPKINNLYEEVINKDTEFNKLYVCDKNIDFKLKEYIDECKFINTNFADAVLDEIRIIDTIFDTCIFTNLHMKNITRAVFKNCNLLGCNFINTSLSDVLFEDCKCDYINFASCKIQNVKFKNCSLVDGRLFDDKIKNIEFDDCDLKDIEVIETKLRGIDLSSCNIEGINASTNSLEGVIIDYYQAMDIVRLLGIKFKN